MSAAGCEWTENNCQYFCCIKSLQFVICCVLWPKFVGITSLRLLWQLLKIAGNIIKKRFLSVQYEIVGLRQILHNNTKMLPQHAQSQLSFLSLYLLASAARCSKSWCTHTQIWFATMWAEADTSIGKGHSSITLIYLACSLFALSILDVLTYK